MMTMKHLLQYELPDGSPVYVEAEVPDEVAGRQRVARQPGEVDNTQQRFVDVIGHIKPAAEAVLDTLRELNTPDEVGLEFGIKLNAKVGAIIASADSEATFKVSLKWANER